ncbi:PepSY domain-containing protein [Pedobacter sp. MC2016-14]|uniref:PepSY-associated TM helix domain-containing protein n=1 Tax=Pedobacter sp. MC2016-14 TaxID=2897327 RepID=UPI001E52C5D5|nr:PepSY-associated TM helix domain-containing protein [Pedobacter sp. MC2016-14]MCD0488393.1 PepSY domain-containing protein [Pedobacter sp. MC2016-14]
MTFKKINAWFHLWLGLISGTIVLILGLTGCTLVFEQEIKSLSSPWLHAINPAGVKAAPPSVLYRSVEKALPGREIESVWYYGKNRTAQFSIHESDSTVYVNPYNTKVVAIAHKEDMFQFFKDGHYYLWMPEKIGHQFVGWGTFIFFFLLISGLILWWPKKWNKKGKEQAFKVKWNAKFKRVNYDLHNVLGFYAIIVALIFAFTGLMMSFSWFNNSVYWMAGGEVKPRIKSLSDTLTHPLNLTTSKMLSQVDKAYYLGINEIGEHHTDEIILHFPEKASDPIYVCTDMYKGSWRDVYLDQYTLKQLPGSNNRLRDENLSSWIRRSNYGLHVGAIGGLTTKIIFFIASLICASLPVTGFYIWWGKKRKAWKSKRKAQSQLITN